MGLGQVFSNIGAGFTGKGRTGYFKGTQRWNRKHSKSGGYAGGYGAITFGNIMHAHCSLDDIIEEFGLDQEDCEYRHPYLRMTCWRKAYQEALREAQIEAAMMAAMGAPVDAEDLIDWDQVEEDAYEYAEDLADLYVTGMVWIPEEILDWAYYDISDHNN